MYHIYEENYCKCRTYGTPRFKDIYENFSSFDAAMATSGIPLKISNTSLSTLYYLLYARYGLSHIATTDTAQFAYQVASTIFMYGPTWEKRLEIQETIRGWSEEELLNGATTINNLAVNPGTAPATTAFEVLSTTNQQTATRHKKSKLDGYGYLMSLLETDVTEDFLFQFNKYFMSFVGYDGEVEGADEPQTKTVTPTKATQYVQADDGYILDTVIVNPIPAQYIIPAGTLEITQNNEYNVENYKRVSVNVEATGPASPDLTDTIESLAQYSSQSGVVYNDIEISGDVLGVYPDGNIIPLTGVSLGTYRPNEPVLYLPSGTTQLIINGNIYVGAIYSNIELIDVPVSWIVWYNDSGSSKVAYSVIEPPTPGPAGNWAIGTDFNGKTISYNPTFVNDGKTIYNEFYPDAVEPVIIDVTFTNGYYIHIEEQQSMNTLFIQLRDPSQMPYVTIFDNVMGNNNTFTFNSSSYTIDTVTYEGISYGLEFGETEFWNKLTNVLNQLITVS